MQRNDEVYDGLDTSNSEELAAIKLGLQETISHLKRQIEEATTTQKILLSLKHSGSVEDNNSQNDEDSSSDSDDITAEAQQALIDKYREVKEKSSQLEDEGRRLFAGVTKADLDEFIRSLPVKK